jgi:hypothetical protein
MELHVGDIVSVDNNWGPTPKKLFVLILSEAQSICNSNGEEWWLEWKGKNLATDKPVNISSRYHKYEKIN